MPAALPDDLALLAPREWTFTVDEYHALGRAGVLDEDSRVELIDGRLIVMSPIGTPHLLSVNRTERTFARRVYASEPPLAVVSVQNPLRLDDGTEPEPDVVLLRPGYEARGTPTPPDALLVVEVADSTVEYDRRVKAPRYARAGVPELWIVVLADRAVEVHRQPGPGGYASVRTAGEGEALGLLSLPDVAAVPVRDVLPPAVT